MNTASAALFSAAQFKALTRQVGGILVQGSSYTEGAGGWMKHGVKVTLQHRADGAVVVVGTLGALEARRVVLEGMDVAHVALCVEDDLTPVQSRAFVSEVAQ